jgi:hypothetical protein
MSFLLIALGCRRSGARHVGLLTSCCAFVLLIQQSSSCTKQQQLQKQRSGSLQPGGTGRTPAPGWGMQRLPAE